ncbi:unnamed protein product [Alopecurus aequalis]
MLSFLCSPVNDRMAFVSTGKFSASFPQDKYRECYHLCDCRHGRVLFGNKRGGGENLALTVWDPMTGRQSKLDAPGYYSIHGAAVLCAVTGCDHSACHDCPLKLVFVGTDTQDGDWFSSVHESFSWMGEWSKPRSRLNLREYAFIDSMPPVLTRDALYFMLLDYHEDEDDNYYAHFVIGILKYDLGSNRLSLIDTPLSGIVIDGDVILMAMQDGCLGFAQVNMLTLYLWSRNMWSNGVASWNACTVIDLGEFLPIQNIKNKLNLIGSMEGNDIIYVSTDHGVYEISLKSIEWKKIWKRETFGALVPYISFYDPLERVNTYDGAH